MKYFLSFLALALLFVACKDTTTDPPVAQTVDTTAIVKAGSMMIYRDLRIDVNGKISDDRGLDTFRFVANGVSVYGKPNVTTIVIDGDPVYIAYETNGDVSINYVRDSIWLRLPVVSKGVTSLDLTDSASGHRTLRAAYVGDDTLSVSGVSFNCEKIRITDEKERGSDLGPDYYWFSRRLGFFARFEDPAFGQDTTGTRSALEHYTLK